VSQLSPEAFIRRVAGFSEMRHQQIEHGLRGIDGTEIVDQKTGENLTQKWLMDPLAQAAKKAGEKWTEVADHAHSYMVALRTIEKATIRQRKGESLDEPISGIAQQFLQPGQQGPLPANTGHADVQAAVDFLKTVRSSPAFDAIDEYSRRSRLWGNEHMRMAVESGLVSKDAARRMLDDNQFYVNMQRVMEKNGAFDKADFSGPYQQRFRGSNREIDNPLRNMLQSTEMIAKKAQINYAKAKIMELAEQVGDKPAAVDKAGRDTVPVFENGELKHYRVTPEVATAVQGWGQHTPPALGGILSMPGRLKAFGTLIRPMFRLNHLLKQTQNRLMISENSGLADTLKMFDPDTRELIGTLGGTMGHERDYGTSSSDFQNLVSKTMDKLTGDNNTMLAWPKKIWDGYQTLGEWSDAANRIAEYKGSFTKAKRNGMSDLTAQGYAAWRARDLMDFGIAGSVVKQINKICYQPFMNAELQGWNKMYSMIRERPGQAAMKIALYGLLPSMIPYFWAKHQGKDSEQKYIDTPLAQRIMFNQFHVGDYRIMVPKGQTQAMASCLWEAFLDKHHGDPAVWMKAMADSGLIPRQVAGVGGLETAVPFQGVRESVSNWNWFYDRHIIPPDQEGLALDLRHTDGASGIGQFMSQAAKKAGWEVDPRKIDHVLSTDLGTSGIDVETGSNLLSGQSKPLAGQAAAGMGYVRLPPGFTSQSVQDSMTAAQRYKDTMSPQYKAVQEPLSKSYQAQTAEERNAQVDKARAAADAANAFYRDHGEDLIAIRESSSKVNQAVAEGNSQQGLQARLAWARANPDKIYLIKAEPEFRALETRVNVLRKTIADPHISESTKDRASRELSVRAAAMAKLAGVGQ
jgi:hypothetical protein